MISYIAFQTHTYIDLNDIGIIVEFDESLQNSKWLSVPIVNMKVYRLKSLKSELAEKEKKLLMFVIPFQKQTKTLETEIANR